MSVDEKTPLINTRSDPKPSGTVSTSGGVFNVTNSIIGGGILALPSAFMAAGVVLGRNINTQKYFAIFSTGLLVDQIRSKNSNLINHSKMIEIKKKISSISNNLLHDTKF
jgi:hypothetical protein